jgi:hypothetical protein
VSVVDVRGTLVVAGVLTVLTLVVAAVVGAACAADARAALGFGFPGVTPRLGEATSIFINNSRLAVAVCAAAAVTQLRWRTDAEQWTDARDSARALRVLGCAVDAALALAAAGNLAVVGASLGAYGATMLRAMLPHGPVELVAYCVLLRLHQRSRRGPVPAAGWVASIATAAALLAVAALLETFVVV